ncbi:protein translocase subunit SecF [Rhizohabitans arisaemae]|uniref:protein translocase subunit SecF n=1 Tax=Rhizohabitans arisaemae TaxID=2720610 RepID=UPI0024B11E99|nr:protein translocase subunit SecF [Rhizohabitans arisaemae]
MSGIRLIASKLYRGEVNIDFVGRLKLWYGISAALIVFSIAGLTIPGLHFGVEFTGGSVFSFKAPAASIEQVRSTMAEVGHDTAIVQETDSNWRVTTRSVPADEVTKIQETVGKRFSIQPDQVSSQVIGPTWGGEVSNKALIGLIVFMIVIIVYLTMAFEWRMALAAVVALVHDLVITAGIYAWTGFEVTPATILGFLTILGYSLYDAVVVFDMIKEVTAPLGSTGKQTYTQAANKALNSTLIRSLNTSLVAILPVASILFIGTTLFGAGTLKDLSLSLFVGMIVGTYSSLCVATPLLAQLKEREPKYQALARRVAANAAAGAKATVSGAKATTPATATATVGSPVVATSEQSHTLPGVSTGPGKQGSRSAGTRKPPGGGKKRR